MKTKFLFPVVVLLCFLTINATAQINHSLRDENRRIRQGVRSGELTARETARLNKQVVQLRRESIRYRANGGHIGPRERADLRGDNRRLSRNIYRQKHDWPRRHR